MAKFQKRVLLQHVRCPECGAPMMDRKGHRGDFYGCSRYPLCVGTRSKGGELDSYSKLLRQAYAKALVFLNSPAQLGYTAASCWLFTKALDREVAQDEAAELCLNDLPNEHIERAVDAACAFATERTGSAVDFLVTAHEERYAAIKSSLKFVTDAEQINRMPRAEIIRRYDSSELSQFEAMLTKTWKDGGHWCPRCGSWGDPVEPPVTKQKRVIFESLFDEKADAEAAVDRSWDCGRCGLFTRTKDRRGKPVYVYAKDKEVKETDHE